MSALLVGASTAGSAALARLGVEFDVVLAREENAGRFAVQPRRIFRRPYERDPFCVLSLPDLADYRGIYSFAELGLLPAAIARTVTGLPGPTVAALARTRSRDAVGLALRRAGLPYPTGGPVGGYGLPGASSNGRTGASLGGLTGPRYGVEIVSRRREHRVLALTEIRRTGHGLEKEVDSPPRLPLADSDRLAGHALACLDAIGIDDTASHGEFDLVGGEPVLVEIRTRPPGDGVPTLVQLTTGWDHYALAVQAGYLDALPVPRDAAVATVARALISDRGLAAAAKHVAASAVPEVILAESGHVIVAGDDLVGLAAVSTRIWARARYGTAPLDE